MCRFTKLLGSWSSSNSCKHCWRFARPSCEIKALNLEDCMAHSCWNAQRAPWCSDSVVFLLCSWSRYSFENAHRLVSFSYWTCMATQLMPIFSDTAANYCLLIERSIATYFHCSHLAACVSLLSSFRQVYSVISQEQHFAVSGSI